MTLVLLPGMDGTGRLFKPFLSALPVRVRVKFVSYPLDIHMSYPQLADRVRAELPGGEPYAIVAESYSGPIALALAAKPAGDLRAVVLVASFVSRPLGSLGRWAARLPVATLLRVRPPAWVLRWLLLDASTPPELVAEVRNTIGSIPPKILAARVREALRVEYTDAIDNCSVRLVCLVSARDRLIGQRSVQAFRRARRTPEIVTISAPHFLLQCCPEAAIAAIAHLELLET